MCGRFAQTNLIKSTSDIVKTVIGDNKIIDNYNISPGNQAAVIKKFTNGKALEFLTISLQTGQLLLKILNRFIIQE